jgi:hypothetical protein
MKTLLKITAVLILFLTTTSCMFDGVRGNGNVVTNNRKISNDFIRIEASRGLDVYITKSTNVSLAVEADENLHDLIETEVRNGTLVITAKKNIWHASTKKVHLSVVNLNEILVSSGAEVYSENTLSSGELSVSATSGAEANLNLNVNNLICKSSSGAGIKLAGKAVNFKANSSSGSDIRAYDLKVENCILHASSGSDIKVYVTDSFEGKATSGADIKYKGNPKIVNRNNNSGGSIRKNKS